MINEFIQAKVELGLMNFTTNTHEMEQIANWKATYTAMSMPVVSRIHFDKLVTERRDLDGIHHFQIFYKFFFSKALCSFFKAY